MSGIVLATVSVSAIGIICAAMLAVASKVMAVQTDERVDNITEILPGANCGACGYPGCSGYAEAIVNDGAETNLCTPGGPEVSKAVSSILGVEAADVVAQVAAVCCRGDDTARQCKMEYSGIETCVAAKLFFGGQNACTFGCLGFGDCAAVCPQDAICIENGLARVDARACIGCKLCVKACPNDIIYMESGPDAVAVLCRNTEKGASVRKKCASGCIACTKCVKECAAGAVSMIDNLARIDYGKCTNCGACADVCMTKCIRGAAPV